MTIHHHPSYDLHGRAHRAMLDQGFEPDIPAAAIRQVEGLEEERRTLTLEEGVRDLRSLLWSSIDNRESRDLDQIEVAETLPNGHIRVLVGIADVDALVPLGSPIDAHADHNKTSVYTGVSTFPMLPDALSADLTSLIQGVDREVVVIALEVDVQGQVAASDIFRALTHNFAKLAYEEVGAWLEDAGPIPPGVAAVPGMDAQIRLQSEAAHRLLGQRQRQGALDFETVEAQPVMEDGRVVDLQVPHKNRARSLIENLMISANMAMATYLETRGVPAIQRIVRSPERWSRIVDLAARMGEHLPPEPDSLALSAFLARRKAADPTHFPDLSLSVVKLLGPGEYVVVRSSGEQAGHFGLAVHSYTHSTAPNRRFADLVIQRLIKAVLANTTAPYTPQILETIAAGCTEREDASRKVERLMRKVVAAVLMADRVGDQFEAIVTGASPKGTYVRLTNPPVEGRVVRGERGLDVGDRARVRLLAADPDRGFIDFECLYEE